ncbi:hypothetical protein MGG_16086 [Pyricularia oryzae 70-15]|uniref:Uncharacterized protein n=3 Tax=Pyricularia oryzae TaxID=318829 RepID=G4MQ55_PYRO7|nr:uncharacterized protein MGG_16086 [Pyricularia oryzae 70-15]EHA56448.1 hypothetical protein MGG_16086 [Pyricularia oryzae 70-15]ELQ41152.1 hypothetical protein OOU_Y34scaffold00298g4 [Pyricularia oryzae Y34]KAI6310132.1 hypothetical protein MCOR29_008734 [Pyricularia oryzae]KAI6486118.1 hypothetical protein MCOR18_003561 [Pyricularia oryzae]
MPGGNRATYIVAIGTVRDPDAKYGLSKEPSGANMDPMPVKSGSTSTPDSPVPV